MATVTGVPGSNLFTTVNDAQVVSSQEWADNFSTLRASWLTLTGAAGARSFLGITIDGTGGLVVVPVVRNITCTGGGLTISSAVSSNRAVEITSPVQTSGSPKTLLITGAAHTTLTAGTESPDIQFDLNRTVQFNSGAITTQRAVRIRAPTYAFVAPASTIATAATLAISDAPSAGANCTITNSYALYVEFGSSSFGGAVYGSGLFDFSSSGNLFAPPTVANDSLGPGGHVIHKFIIPSGVTGNVDFVLTKKTEILDAHLIKTAAAGGGAGTIQVQTGAGAAITDAMSINVADETVIRAGTINDANSTINAAATLRFARTRTASTDESCIAVIRGILRA